MLNKIWFGMLLIGILYGFGKGAYNSYFHAAEKVAVQEEESAQQIPEGSENSEEKSTKETDEALSPRDLKAMGKAINDATFQAAEVSVEICLGLIGFMALWLGLMQVAYDSGMIDTLARLFSPVMRWLFPEVPAGHPAQGAMLMNMAANVLGLDNAATPLGLKAMQELQELNPQKDTATNSMAMFMAINTSSVTLIPFTIIAYRATKESVNPTEPILGIVIVTTISTIVAIVAVRLLSKSPRFALAPNNETSQLEKEAN